MSGALLPGLVGAVCVALPLLAWKTKGLGRALPYRSYRRPAPIELVLGVFLALEVAAIFYLSYVHTLGGDGILNFEIKARYAYLNDGVLPLKYLQDASRSFSHPEYPLAIPYTELWLYFWLGEANQFWAKTIFPVFYLAGMVLLVTLGTRLTGKTWAGLIGAILLFFVPQISIDGGSVTVGYADFPLSVFYLATIGYLLCACRANDEGSFWIYAGCLALLPWLKREGTLLWIVAALCGVLVIWRTKKSFAHLFAFLPGALVILGWRFYLWKTDTVASTDFLPVTAANLGDNIHRVGPILSEFMAELVNGRAWSLFWLLVAVGSVYFVRRFRDVRSVVLLIAVIAPISVYIFIFIFSRWPDYQQHIGLSISRLFMQLAPLSCLTVIVALAAGRTREERGLAPQVEIA